MGKYRPIHHLVNLRILYMQIRESSLCFFMDRKHANFQLSCYLYILTEPKRGQRHLRFSQEQPIWSPQKEAES